MLIKPPKRDVAAIHTSDRIQFRRCRRKWSWTSGLQMNLQPNIPIMPLWFGTGFHYALEDYHGYNKYGHPKWALLAYLMACRKTPAITLPDGWEDEVAMGIGILDYYVEWCEFFGPLETYVVDGVPQVEVSFEIMLPESCQKMARKAGYKKAVYRGTFDKVCIDEFDRLWVLDYKTCKMIRHDHFEGDTQISAYCWAAEQLYKKTIGGMIYQQHVKGPIKQLQQLQSGEFSVNKAQKVTWLTARKEIVEKYGSINKAPAKLVEFLNHLASVQPETGDRMIDRTFVNRSPESLQSQAKQIEMEALEMLNPDTFLYPNQQFTCSWDCNFKSACASMDDGSDWEYDLEQSTQPRPQGREERWKNYLPDLETVQEYHDK